MKKAKKVTPSLRDNQTRVCFYMDKDILRQIKELAIADRMKYQPFLNRLIRESLKRVGL